MAGTWNQPERGLEADYPMRGLHVHDSCIVYIYTCDPGLLTSSSATIMGNCIKPAMEPDQSPEGLLTRELRGVIFHLTQEIEAMTREAEMHRHQVATFLQEIENRDREISVLKTELRRIKMKTKKVRFTN